MDRRLAGTGVAALLGALLGGLVAFLLRPSAFLVGQLPFDVVITRGATLKGVGQLYTSVAHTSFNMLVAGVIVGAVVGWIVGCARR
jgi:hypothetical protein